ncbi:MAG: hypothetical protein GY861_04455 [bacterium]|nr:hypothetical protein [bacterium]
MKMKAQAGKKIIMIFFLIVALSIACYIGVKSAGTYNDTKNYSVSHLKSSVECVGYIFKLSGIEYDDGSLSFTLENQPHSSHTLNALIINATNVQKVELGNFVPSAKKSIVVEDIQVDDTFTVYHDGCPGFTKQCSISTANCEHE